jgi:cell wall-associated NlpC family hydrolase
LLRAACGVLALSIAAGGVTDAVASRGDAAGAVRPAAQIRPAALVTAAAGSPTTDRTTSVVLPRSIWVGASVATVWVRPGRTRPVDRPALAAQPRIARWISHQSLRQRNDLASRVMTQALHGDALVLLASRDGWSKVELPDQRGSHFRDGIIGWVPTRQLTDARPAQRVLHPGVRPHGNGRGALRAARSFLGIRYLWGGMSRSGLDCSGLTYRVYRQFGWVLPRDAADQSRLGRPVRRHDLRRGDLVFFGSGAWQNIHHVGIYAGHGRVLHAPHTGTRVQVTPLRLWHDYWGARRIL